MKVLGFWRLAVRVVAAADDGKQVISETDRPRLFRAENEPIFYAKNHVGMSDCTETMVRRFSDRRPVLVPSPYAYWEASWLVLAVLAGSQLPAGDLVIKPPCEFLARHVLIPLDHSEMGSTTTLLTAALGAVGLA